LPTRTPHGGLVTTASNSPGLNARSTPLASVSAFVLRVQNLRVHNRRVQNVWFRFRFRMYCSASNSPGLNALSIPLASVSGCWMRVAGLGFRVSGFGSGVSGIEVQGDASNSPGLNALFPLLASVSEMGRRGFQFGVSSFGHVVESAACRAAGFWLIQTHPA